ncbi:GntR family transcriptional regulator [Advenella incenata]|jgi:DNA-binding GntR family transcriptional regulator
MTSLATTNPVTLSAQTVTDQLRALILDGSLGIGVQLKQEALARKFGVSRIPIREALKRLEAEGLVAHTAHQGSVVASRSIDDLLETLDIRIGLESRALVLAIPHMTPAILRKAETILARYDASDMPGEWSELNLAFHLCLYKPCGRQRLLSMIESLVRSVDIHLRAHQSAAIGRKSPQKDHRALLEACRAGNAERARKLLERHIVQTQQALHNARPQAL